MSKTMEQQYNYYAFINDSSKDTEWGKRAQRKLEHYRMPATLFSEHGWERLSSRGRRHSLVPKLFKGEHMANSRKNIIQNKKLFPDANIGCDVMKKLFLFTFVVGLLLTNAVISQAQSLQQGVVKTRGRMVNGVLVPGEKIGNAMVSIRGRSAVLSGIDGLFRFPVTGKTFIVDSVKKKDYALIDYEACRQYRFPQSPFVLLMEKPEKQRADQLDAERKIRRNLQRQLQEREDEIEALQASQQQKDSLLRILYQQQGDNEKLIADMAKRYSTIDYDQLDEFYRQVSWFIENGELIRADSLLRTRGDISMQVQGILNNGKAIQEQREQIQKAETVHQADIEEAARRCYSYYETYFAQNQNDSAAYYLELRASMDSTNLDWQLEAGRFCQNYLADYIKAMYYYQPALRNSLSQYGEYDGWTATCYANIGSALYCQNDFGPSLEYHIKAQNIFEMTFGTNHPTVALAYNNIGLVYDAQGDYSKSLECYNKALTIFLNTLGNESPYVGASYNNIGGVYHRQGYYSKALEYLTKALNINEKAFGAENPIVATFYNNLGGIYETLGDYSKAMVDYQRALEVREKVLGVNHPDVALSYNNIGNVYIALGEYSKALEYHTKALVIREKVFGLGHPDVAQSYNNIGSVRHYQGDNEKALYYFKKALAIREKVFDDNHPDVATSYSNIGTAQAFLGDYSKALDNLAKALSIQEKTFGPEHSSVAITYNSFGVTYARQGDYSKALSCYKKALTILEKAYGKEHLQVAMSYNNIGEVYHIRGDFQMALDNYTKSLVILEKIYGDNNTIIGTINIKIGTVYFSLGNYAKALEHYFIALDVQKRMLGANHHDVAMTYINIGGVYQQQGDNSKAIQYYDFALTILEIVYGKEHPNTIAFKNNLIQIKQKIMK